MRFFIVNFRVYRRRKTFLLKVVKINIDVKRSYSVSHGFETKNVISMC